MSKRSKTSKKKNLRPSRKSASVPKAKAPKAKAPEEIGGASPRWHLWVLLAVTAGALSPMLFNGFTNWDDLLYVTNNKLIRSLSFDNLKAIWDTPIVSNFHPLTIISLAINYQISELQPFGYHLTSLILHLINVGLVYTFSMKLSEGRHWVSLFVAAIFAIHPLHVESVAWISERKDLLYTLFFVWSMNVYLDYLKKGKLIRLVIIGILMTLSLMSKPAAVVLPVVLLLLDYYKSRKVNWQMFAEKIPYFALSVIFGIIALQIQSQKAIASLDVYSWFDRIQFAGYGFMWYLIKFVAPFGLSALHPFPNGELNILFKIAPFVSLIVCVYLLFVQKNKLVKFGLMFYLITIALVLQLLSVGTAVVAERYTYVPYIGVAFAIGMLIAGWLEKSEQEQKRKIVFGVIGTVCLLFAVLSGLRTTVWENSETLWNDALKKYPESHRAWTNRGLYYYEIKDYERALADIDKGIQYKPNFVTGIEWRGKTNYQLKKYRPALKDANLFVKIKPRNWMAHLDRAKALGGLKRYDEAEKSYSRALELNENSAEVYNNRGVLYFNRLQRYQDALNDFDRAIAINGNNGMYYLNRARCHYMMGQMKLARDNVAIAKSLGTSVDPSFEEMIK